MRSRTTAGVTSEIATSPAMLSTVMAKGRVYFRTYCKAKAMLFIRIGTSYQLVWCAPSMRPEPGTRGSL